MIVDFDTRISWRMTPADYEEGQDRRYYAAPGPHMLIAVVRPEAAAQLGHDFGNAHGAKFDCLIGDHREGGPSGFTLPRFAGYRHSKITIFRRVDDDEPAATTLTEILAASPRIDEPEYLNYQKPGDAVELAISLSQTLLDAARDLAGRRGMTIDGLIAEALLQQLENQ